MWTCLGDSGKSAGKEKSTLLPSGLRPCRYPENQEDHSPFASTPLTLGPRPEERVTRKDGGCKMDGVEKILRSPPRVFLYIQCYETFWSSEPSKFLVNGPDRTVRGFGDLPLLRPGNRTSVSVHGVTCRNPSVPLYMGDFRYNFVGYYIQGFKF